MVVGLTKHDEGEFLDREALGRLGHLFPPIDDPELGFPSEREREAAFARMAERRAEAAKDLASDEVDFVSGGDRRSLGLLERDSGKRLY